MSDSIVAMNENKAKHVISKIIVELSRIILGVTFVFSGFVKLVDPYGTAYKIEDYFSAFGLTILNPLSMPISFLQSSIEFVMGAFLLLGIYRKINSRFLLYVMIFMTTLTLYLAIANPVKDCGCFGDALILTNWETFYKNIVLLICSIVIYFKYESISNFYTGRTYWMAFLYIVFFSLAFQVYNYIYDPIIDFRPYKIGNHLPDLMKVEEGKGPIDESILIYAKDGVEKEFSQDNFPWEDSTWTFVRMETKVIQEGEIPPVHDFVINRLILNENKNDFIGQNDITETVLSDTNYVFLMVSPSLADMDKTYLSNFEDVMNYADEYHYRFYCLTASVTADIVAWERENAVDLNFCQVDERTLKTIIRTNPGLVLLKEGTVINKWADIETPAEENLTAPLDQLSYSQMIDVKKTNKENIIYISLIFILPLLLFKGFDLLLFRKISVDGTTKKVIKKDNNKLEDK